MNIINIALGVDSQPCSSITLGRRGENEVTQVVVDFSSWVEEFGAGVITLLAMRSQDTSAYPVVLSLDGNTATWNVTSTDTAYKGSGRAEYIYTVGEQIAKSVVFGTTVLQDIGEPSGTPPDPYEEWLERLTELGAETQANAEAAQQSAEDAEQSAQEAAQSAASAEGYAGQAETAAGLAQAAQTASEAARDAAQTAQASAESSATAASGSAASAAGSATAAAGSASDASSSASAAGASATTASTAAGQAEAAKTAAQAAQSAAEDAAEDAQQAAQQAHVEYEQLSDAVDDLTEDVAQQKSAIDDLTALVDRKAGALIDTASGSIASFVPDSTIPDLLGVSVDIEPVQDLHGYDNPWPSGGGKNIWNPTLVAAVSTTNPFSVDGDTYTMTWVNGAAAFSTPRNQPFPAGQYTLSVISLNSDAERVRLYIYKVSDGSSIGSGASPKTFQAAEPFYVTVGGVYNDPGTAIFKIQLESGSTPTSYAPYENICPISGWDAVEVDAAGINVWDEVTELGTYSLQTGLPVASGYSIRGKNRFPVKPSTGYYCNNQYLRILYYDANDSFLSFVTGAGVKTTPENCAYIRLYLGDAYGTTYNHDVSINYPSTDHAYHPYSGNRYTIALGDTVYGGTLDVTNGTLTVDRYYVTLANSARVSYHPEESTPSIWMRYESGKLAKVTGGRAMSNIYRIGGGVAPFIAYYGTEIDIYDARFTDEQTALSLLADFKCVYTLATPITIQLDPVTISTISGQTNNVWADAGDVSVEFAADLKHYIDSKIAAAVAAMS